MFYIGLYNAVPHNHMRLNKDLKAPTALHMCHVSSSCVSLNLKSIIVLLHNIIDVKFILQVILVNWP